MLRILIVEDNDNFRNTFKEALSKRFPFLVIEEAVDGREALLKVEAFLPHVVFMDIRLPGHSGIELTKRIKASHPESIVIILTNYDFPEYREAASNAGGDYFVPKASVNLADIAEFVKSKLPGGIEGVRC